MITVGELFAGIGGIGLGLEMTGGFEVKWQVEIDEYASQVLTKHWPDVTRWDDVCTFPPADGDWTVDMITAGFPCQNISSAGDGKGLDGRKSGLFYEVVRIAHRLRPRLILLENVATLLIRGIDRVLGELAAIGYDSEWHCIPAVALGALHRRDRVFILAYPEHDGCDRDGTNEHKCECQKMGGSEQPWGDGGDRVVADSNRERRCGRDSERKNAAYVRQSPRSAQSGYWDIEPAVGRVANGIPKRVDRLRALGNAVVPQITQFIGNQILERLKDDSARR